MKSIFNENEIIKHIKLIILKSNFNPKKMNPITITSTINASIHKVWDCWTNAEHVTKWNFASDDWHCPEAKNNLIVGGEFHYIMAAKDNSMQFDFWGTFKEIIVEKSIDIFLGDGRKLSVTFDFQFN
jgi:uncharacterized protein YndB with AHSA1/START domain